MIRIVIYPANGNPDRATRLYVGLSMVGAAQRSTRPMMGDQSGEGYPSTAPIAACGMPYCVLAAAIARARICPSPLCALDAVLHRIGCRGAAVTPAGIAGCRPRPLDRRCDKAVMSPSYCVTLSIRCSRSRTRRTSSYAAAMSPFGNLICPRPSMLENDLHPASRRMIARSKPRRPWNSPAS
jgi:hypothetical protein